MILPFPPSENDEPDLDALNRELQKVTDTYNHTPNPEIGGFSPDMLMRLNYTEWNTPESPLKLNAALSLEMLRAAPYFISLRNFLLYVVEQGSVKATATGNLSRKVVMDQLDAFWTPRQKESWFSVSKVANEEDVHPLNCGRYILEFAGLLKKRKSTFYVPKSKQGLLEEKKAGELADLLFVTHFRKFQLGYNVRYAEKFDLIQQDAGYLLFTMGLQLKEWTVVDVALVRKLLHPMTLGALREALKPSRYVNETRVLSAYLLMPFLSWGLLECESPEVYCLENKKIRVSAFYRKWIRFK